MTTCILLAGGLGTRLRDAVPGVPKCLAPVAGTPFLEIQMERLAAQGVERFVLSLGHRAEQVIAVASSLGRAFRIESVVESEPLGTGGAALLAMSYARVAEALLANADTLWEADLRALRTPLEAPGELIRMGVMHAPDAGRFGGVALKGARVERFLPRAGAAPGLVNAGVYRIHSDAFAGHRPGQAFSFEAELMAPLVRQGRVSAAVLEGSMLDIGVPADYQRFCEAFTASRA